MISLSSSPYLKGIEFSLYFEANPSKTFVFIRVVICVYLLNVEWRQIVIGEFGLTELISYFSEI